MKRSLSLLVVPALLVVGCGGSKKKPTVLPDMTVTDKGDMTVGDGCIQLGAWPTNHVFAKSDLTQSFPYVDIVGDTEPNATNPAHQDTFRYRYYQESGNPMPEVPHDFDMDPNDPADTFGQCLDCVTLNVDVDPSEMMTSTVGTFYYATEGSIHVEKLDHGIGTGTISASGTNLHLVHWDYDFTNMKDEADPDGKCIDVASFDFTADYDNEPTDGGIDAGT